MSEPIMVNEVDGGDKSRVKLLLIAAAALVFGALVLPRFLFGGGDGADELEFGAPTTPPAAEQPAGAGDGAGEGEATPEVVQAFSTRNPFTPLVSAASAPPAGAGDPPPVVIDEPPVVVPDPDPFPTLPPYWPPSEQPPVTQPPAEPPPVVPPAQPTEQRFTLLEVFQDQVGQVLARVRINDVVHEPAVGYDFADRYRFVSADLVARCASFLYGDHRFELCEGEETRH